jgi:PIN domain nuclease of toxin-antitoxin system
MNLLLDTNVLIWSLFNPARLSQRASAALVDPRNAVWVSTICAWEMAIKVALGKLNVPRDVGLWLPVELDARRFTELPATIAHAAATEHLPLHHNDPFDRLLIAQAITQGLTIVTGDRVFQRYGIPLIRT